MCVITMKLIVNWLRSGRFWRTGYVCVLDVDGLATRCSWTSSSLEPAWTVMYYVLSERVIPLLPQ